VRARTVAVRATLIVLAAAAAVWAAQRYVPVYVGGGSMAPALVAGDLAIVRRGSDTVRTGDIVLVAKPGWPRGVLHRVDGVMPDGTLRLRGDANPVADRDPAPAWRVRGVVALVVPMGRALAALEHLALRWYNPASQEMSEATTQRREREHATPVQRGARWLEGLRGGERLRFTPTAASREDRDGPCRGGRTPPVRGRRGARARARA
jgi:hypothetical protein